MVRRNEPPFGSLLEDRQHPDQRQPQRQRQHEGGKPARRPVQMQKAAKDGARFQRRQQQKQPGRHPSGRALRSTELKALQTLGLDDTATPDQVKTQYKTLVKRLHPDANGGSRANEDTLKAVIQAYDHLRSSGFC